MPSRRPHRRSPSAAIAAFALAGAACSSAVAPNGTAPADAATQDVAAVRPDVPGVPPQCAAVNRTNINMQLLTIEAALTGKREHVYHAALLDPHTSAELAIDDIVAMCDEMLEANRDFLPFMNS